MLACSGKLGSLALFHIRDPCSLSLRVFFSTWLCLSSVQVAVSRPSPTLPFLCCTGRPAKFTHPSPREKTPSALGPMRTFMWRSDSGKLAGSSYGRCMCNALVTSRLAACPSPLAASVYSKGLWSPISTPLSRVCPTIGVKSSRAALVGGLRVSGAGVCCLPEPLSLLP